MKLNGFDISRKEIRRAKLLTLFCISFFLLSCATANTQLAATTRAAAPEASPRIDAQDYADEPDVVDKETESSNESTGEVADVVVSAVSTVQAVAEYIKEEVVPTVLGFTLVYLLYEASKISESFEQNESTETP